MGELSGLGPTVDALPSYAPCVANRFPNFPCLPRLPIGHHSVQYSHPTTSRGVSRRPARTRRRGVAMVIAMLFLVLFSVMALGFYAAVTTGARVSGNERYRSASFL